VTRPSSILVALVLLGFPSLPYAQHADTSFTLDARSSLGAYRAMAETQLESVLGELTVLASTAEVSSGDWARIGPLLKRHSQRLSIAAAVWFAEPAGSYYTVATGLVAGQTLRDREYFPTLMAGHDVEGQLVISKSTGERSIIVGTPVWRDGHVVGALGVSVSVEKLAAWIDARLELPPNVVFYALDSAGRTALHRDSALMFEFPSDMGSESLAAAVQMMLGKPAGTVRYTFRDAHKVAAFERSTTTGWVFVLGQALP